MSKPEELWVRLKATAPTLHQSALTQARAESIVKDLARQIGLDPRLPADAIQFYASELRRMATHRAR